jgi:hypothetical protein
MSRIARIFVLSAIVVPALLAIVAQADNGDVAASAPAYVPGWFEQHFVATEMIVLAFLVVLIWFGMRSNVAMQQIWTYHTNFGGKRLFYSVTDVPIPTTPSTPAEIRKSLRVLGVIYLALRCTCLFGFLTETYQIIGSLFDLVIRLIFD